MNKTAIVMGNGKSLLEMPKELLQKYDSFGVNYALYNPTHYVCIDTTVLTEFAAAVYPLAAQARKVYLSQLHADCTNPDTQRLYALPQVQLVGKDGDAFKDELVLSGYNAAYVALKMAFYEGYEKVLLWGVDQDADWAHYCKDYPPAQYINAQRLALMKAHLDYANEVFRWHQRKILNFSRPSGLNFERGDHGKDL